MPKKKKKKKTTVSPKLLHARRMNELKRRVLQIVKAIGAEEAFHLIPPDEKEFLFFVRIKPFDVEPAQGQNIPPGDIRLLKKLAVQFLKFQKFKINETEISLYDYFYAGEQLRWYIRNLEEDKYQNAPVVKKAFATFMEITNNKMIPAGMAFDTAKILSQEASHLTDGIFFLKYDPVVEKGNPPVFYSRYLAEFIEPEFIKYRINGETRTAYRLVWPVAGKRIIWAQISLEKLGLNKQIKNLKADVYIQKHAIQRLEERLDCIYFPIIISLLVINIEQCSIVKNKKGQQLIEFNVLGKKVGYLVYKYVQGVVVIRTFLLATNNDTPEAEKLQDLCGLEKPDMQYLRMDKLSAFAFSDMVKNDQLKKIFEQAGCKGLFEVADILEVNDVNEMQNAAKIVQYLKLNETAHNPAELPVE